MALIKKPKAKSVAEAVSAHSHDHLKSIAKNALKTYIASFLETTGPNRSVVETISPSGLNFVVDKSLQDSQDTRYKPTQLAIIFKEIRQKFPAIIIAESSFTRVPCGLNGGLEHAANLNGKWQGFYRVAAKVGVSVVCASQDQTTTDTLQNILYLLFEPMRNITGGSRLFSSEPSHNWEVRLPLEFTMGQTTGTLIEGDNKDQIWSATIEMELAVEDLIVIEQEMSSFTIERGFANTNQADGWDIEIVAPTQVRFQDGPFSIEILHFVHQKNRVVLSDANMASIDLTSLTINPRKIGTFSVLVLDITAKEANMAAPYMNKTVATHTIQIKP